MARRLKNNVVVHETGGRRRVKDARVLEERLIEPLTTRWLRGTQVPGELRLARPSNCGDFLKPLLPQPVERQGAHRVNRPGMVKTERMSQWIIRSQALRLSATRAVQRLDGGRSVQGLRESPVSSESPIA